MKIGIHDRPGSFSDRWIDYCLCNGVSFRRVNCLASDVVAQCEDLDVLLWHWPGSDPVNSLVATQIIASLEAAGLQVFPNFDTCWHYDDKIAQKYLLEAIGAPLVPTWVFLDQTEAMNWIDQATWPKVFKLRCGAGSSNVRLVRSRAEAVSICKRSFGSGFPAVAGYLADMSNRLRSTRNSSHFWERLARAPRTLRSLLSLRRRIPREKGYLYLQEFLPDNAYDTRITIIGNRAFGFRRMNRPNDFRASGSGKPMYDPEKIDYRCVELAFRVADRLRTQSLAFDFLFGPNYEPMIGEISYCYVAPVVRDCPGHWDRDGAWYHGHTWPQDAILEDLLASLR